jgi:hypothetical protein
MTDTTPTKMICHSERAKSEPARQLAQDDQIRSVRKRSRARQVRRALVDALLRRASR